MAPEEVATPIVLVEVQGGPPLETLHQRLSSVPGFRGLTSRDGKMYACFPARPSKKDEAEMHRLCEDETSKSLPGVTAVAGEEVA